MVQICGGIVSEACSQVWHHNAHLERIIHDVSKSHAPFGIPHLNLGKIGSRVEVISCASHRKFEYIRAFGPREKHILEAICRILDNSHNNDFCSFGSLALFLQFDVSYRLNGKSVNCFETMCLPVNGD